MWLEYLLSGEGFRTRVKAEESRSERKWFCYLKVYLLYMSEREAEERKREKKKRGN